MQNLPPQSPLQSPPLPHHNSPLLSELSLRLLEKAFLYLVDPHQKEPPPELQHLSPVQWFAVQNLLHLLYLEQSYSSLQ